MSGIDDVGLDSALTSEIQVSAIPQDEVTETARPQTPRKG